MSELPTESGRLNAPMRRNFSSGETNASIFTMPLPLICGPRFSGSVYLPSTNLETKTVDLGIVMCDRCAEVQVPIARHRSEELTVRVYHRPQIFRLGPFVAFALAHPDFVVMWI